MKTPVFITGNQHKADFLAKWLKIPIAHQKLELDELQSFDLHEIVEHKARQAYRAMQRPVLVEDVGLTFHFLGKLPGPFIKWFLQELSYQQLCDLLPPGANRSATSAISYCWFDGKDTRFFDGKLSGSIVLSPRGTNGFGFDPIFMPAGSTKTHAEMTDKEQGKYSLRTTTVFPELRDFFALLDK